MKVTGVGVWNAGLRFGDAGEAAEAAAELEELGYTAVWIPDAGGDVFGAVEGLLSATRTITVATGILNLWMHTPEETASAHGREFDRGSRRSAYFSACTQARVSGDIGVFRPPIRIGYLGAVVIVDLVDPLSFWIIKLGERRCIVGEQGSYAQQRY